MVRSMSSQIGGSLLGSVRTVPAESPTLSLFHLHGLVLTRIVYL